MTSYDIGTKDPVTGLNTFIYDNVGEANIRGVELATQIPVYDKWHVSANYTFTDSRRKSDDESLNGKSLKGEPLERTPRHAANAKLEWDYTQDITFYSSLNYTENKSGQHKEMVLRFPAFVMDSHLWILV